MKDIKSLFIAAKSSGRPDAVAAYTEAVNELLESNPRDYISNVEYIISSSIGAPTFERFVERYGIPVAAYDDLIEAVDEIIRSGEAQGKNVEPQKKVKSYLEAFHDKYKNCFMMYESVQADHPEMFKGYTDTYYGFTKNAQNKKLVAGMFSRFKEAALPDIFITADQLNAQTQMLEYLNSLDWTPTQYQWLSEMAHDIIHGGNGTTYVRETTDRAFQIVNEMGGKSLQSIVDNCRSRNQAVYREAMIMGDTDKMMEYAPHEIQAIEDLISFNEYKMLFLEGADRDKCYQDVLSLYEELDGLLPRGASIYTESNDPRKQTIKEITRRLIVLAGDVRKDVKAVLSGDKNYDAYSANVTYGKKNGAQFYSKQALKKAIKKNMKDISDFSDEWMEDIFMLITFTASGEHRENQEVANRLCRKIGLALTKYVKDEKIAYIDRHAVYPDTPVRWTFHLPMKVNKSYAVGDSDLGMFESVEELTEEIADSVIPLLTPEVKVVNEARWMFNTSNKKNGHMPGYISKNHDLGWGEGDDDGPRRRSVASDDEDGDTEHSLDDFKRPSAVQDDQEDVGDDTDTTDPTPTVPASPGGVSNYYYYTYNNSLNKNSNSFNRTQRDDHSTTTDDHSVRTRDDHSSSSDDHSVRSKDDHSVSDNHSIRSADDHSVRTSDDHSIGKRTKSDNFGPQSADPLPEQEEEEDDIDGGKPADGTEPEEVAEGEESGPFADGGSYSDSSCPLSEAVDYRTGKIWSRECDAFKDMFNVDLNKLGDVRSPAKEIALTIGGKTMTFRSSLGNVPGKTEKLHNYSQVPTAVHQYNVHKDRIRNDKIGIDRCILHYLKLRDRGFDPNTTLAQAVKKYNIKPRKIIFNLCGEIGLTFSCNIGKFGVLIDQDFRCKDGDEDIVYTEAVGDADDMKPKSDHPIRDTFQDIDRTTVKYQQKAKKKVQEVQQAGRAIMKPVNRTGQWLTNMVNQWRDARENNIKEKMADPHSRNVLFSALKKSIIYGSLAKAGLLLNPIFLFLGATRLCGKRSREFRIRNEMIGELKTELQIIDEKIKDADSKGDNKAKYQLMRFKNELNKKLLRVGGTKEFKKII